VAGPERSPLTLPTADPHACTPGVRLRALAQAPMFAMLGPQELADVDARCRTVGFQEGEPIYHAGDRAERLLVVVTGAVKLTRLGPEGREVLTDVLTSGEFLGALPALGEERHAESAWALSAACLLVFGVSQFEAVLNRHPPVALAALGAVSRRLADANRAIQRLATAPVDQRLAATLVLLADKVGERDDRGTLLQAPLTREDLAAMTGAVPETVSRVLSQWRRLGLLDAGRRWVRLRDRPALEAIAAG
jgi:CRP-like cAMP-binding protein